MPTEKELTRELIRWLEKYELEIKALNFTLAAMRVAHPEFPAHSLLEQARERPQFRDEVQARYKPLYEVVDQAELLELLKDAPVSEFPN